MKSKLNFIIAIAPIYILLGCSNGGSQDSSASKFDVIKYHDNIMRNVVMTYFSQYENREIEYEILKDDLKAAPLWNANNSPNPKLMPREAVVSAQKELKKLGIIPNNWCLYSICMSQVGMIPDKTNPWIYLVEYRSSLSKEKGRIVIPVLMNGEAIRGQDKKR